MLSTLFSIITSRLLWGFVGITALAFIIWMTARWWPSATIARWSRNSTARSPSALST